MEVGVAERVQAEAFRLFPYGILVFDESGRLTAWNSAASQLLDGLAVGASCCSILGCRSSGGPLDAACLTELARAHAAVLPEVRVDLSDGNGGEQARWITAAPLGEDSSRLVVEVRPGDPRDRRRRTVPHWVAAPQLRIRTFGHTRVESREGGIDGDWLSLRPGQILKYLVCQRHRVVHTDEIAEAIWPGSDLSAARSVRYFIHVVRSKIEPQRRKRAPSSFLVSRQGGYMLDTEAVYIDADEFEHRVVAGLAAFERRAPESATRELEEAVAMYTGDFLADEPYTQWALAERDRLRQLASDSLRALAVMRLESSDNGGAIRLVERLCALQPYDLDVHRQLIALLKNRGRHSDAARRYGALRRKMLLEFAEEPGFTLADVSPDEIALD